MLLFRLFVLSGILGRSLAQNKKCYYPNGLEAKDDFPCDPDAEDSVCCGGNPGSVCLTNKLCSNTDIDNTVRGACTDSGWTSPECPYFCLGATTGGTDLVSCSNVTDNELSYCCDHNDGCCESGVGRFNVFPAEVQVWATFNPRSSRFVAVKTDSFDDKTTSTSAPASTTSTSTTATSSTSVSIPTSTSESTSKDSSSTQSTTTSTTETSAPSDSTGDPAAANPPEPDSGLSTPAIAGIAAGSAVAIILAVAAAALLIWRRHRRNKKAQRGAPGYDSHTHPTFYSGHYNGNPYPPQYIPKEGNYWPQELHGHQAHAQFERAELATR